MYWPSMSPLGNSGADESCLDEEGVLSEEGWDAIEAEVVEDTTIPFICIV